MVLDAAFRQCMQQQCVMQAAMPAAFILFKILGSICKQTFGFGFITGCKLTRA